MASVLLRPALRLDPSKLAAAKPLLSPATSSKLAPASMGPGHRIASEAGARMRLNMAHAKGAESVKKSANPALRNVDSFREAFTKEYANKIFSHDRPDFSSVENFLSKDIKIGKDQHPVLVELAMFKDAKPVGINNAGPTNGTHSPILKMIGDVLNQSPEECIQTLATALTRSNAPLNPIAQTAMNDGTISPDVMIGRDTNLGQEIKLFGDRKVGI